MAMSSNRTSGPDNFRVASYGRIRNHEGLLPIQCRGGLEKLHSKGPQQHRCTIQIGLKWVSRRKQLPRN